MGGLWISDLNSDCHPYNISGEPSKEGDIANTRDAQAVNENNGEDDKGIKI